MQKFMPSFNPQRSAPTSMRRLNSISNSGCEVLMNEYLNLPLISTKSSKGNQKIHFTKPNTISIIQNLDNQNQYHCMKNNTIPLQILIRQGENSITIPNYTFIEKYNQNKIITTNKQKEAKVAIKLQQYNLNENKYSSHQAKNVKNFNNSNNSLVRDAQIEQGQFQSINNEFSPQHSFYNLNLVSNNSQKINVIQQLTQRIDFLRRKLKVCFLTVFTTQVISRKQRFLKKEQAQITFKLNNQLQSCQQIINKNGIKQIEELQYQFVYVIANKVIHYLQSQTYVNECNQIDELSNSIYSLDMKFIRVQSFSKLIYQNLELLTRKNNFPELLKSQLINSLFKTSKQQTSYFVGERCHFYQANKIHISREQQLAITMEFLLFQIIIPNLLQLINKITQVNQKCKIQTQKIMVIISSLLHQQFIIRFQNMRKVKNPNGYMINKRFSIYYSENGLFYNQITISENKYDSNQVLEGLVEQVQLLKYENSKPSWKSQIDRLFEKILSNIESLIDF